MLQHIQIENQLQIKLAIVTSILNATLNIIQKTTISTVPDYKLFSVSVAEIIKKFFKIKMLGLTTLKS